ncbi:hypothetical protein AJ85_16885 [Alkalihalobacillus alcalophilus ATCC 27647 = CGMCC 1.3604]|uniref:Uncharacterized protein n=1 Tax=Alkalihalobacillus alcalophilus ATCC 27647 = CGMCC 1.3604 TaxID=1218173 RepID=A0A094WLG0_ALKAL|nr:hypothetical protein [Alkalihalobacillus alcalophilus]KGA96743.1 hypothetical protein BALCAV_0214390 [Alkalihalobacillus alcalophilus ATCC 27647 = CGMCC 1.3604]MED1563814.1 hypothetical protein [Alkalihalobacillus alcalophilus]THG92119.1 hypothetical protein AJ85_16885 [Alkalihalobacillus alcalophilus ATCC 27647 = CGMCC 1.3604]
MEEVENVDLFQPDHDEVMPQLEHNERQEFIIKETNLKKSYIQMVSHYLSNDRYKESVMCLVVPSASTLLGTEKNVLPSGANLTVEIEPGVYFYANFSTEMRERAVQKFAQQINIEIEVLW